MIRKIFVLATVTLLFTGGYAHAFYVPQLRSAETLGWGSLNLSTGVGVYEHAVTVFGNARYGIASPVDVSLTIGLMDLDATDNASLLIGSDIQYQVADTDMGKPVDVAIGGIFQYYSYDRNSVSTSIWSLGGNLIVSKPLQFQNGFRFTPYSRLNMRSDNVRQDSGTNPLFGKRSALEAIQATRNNSEFNIGITIGSQFHFTGKFNVSGELQIDDEIGAAVGLNFFMW